MHAHRARGVPASCCTHPRGDPVLLAPSPRLNRELYPHTRGFPVGPAGNPLSPSPCSSLSSTMAAYLRFVILCFSVYQCERHAGSDYGFEGTPAKNISLGPIALHRAINHLSFRHATVVPKVIPLGCFRFL